MIRFAVTSLVFLASFFAQYSYAALASPAVINAEYSLGATTSTGNSSRPLEVGDLDTLVRFSTEFAGNLHWEFGTGDVSFEQQPSYRFHVPGEFRVSAYKGTPKSKVLIGEMIVKVTDDKCEPIEEGEPNICATALNTDNGRIRDDSLELIVVSPTTQLRPTNLKGAKVEAAVVGADKTSIDVSSDISADGSGFKLNLARLRQLNVSPPFSLQISGYKFAGESKRVVVSGLSFRDVELNISAATQVPDLRIRSHVNGETYLLPNVGTTPTKLKIPQGGTYSFESLIPGHVVYGTFRFDRKGKLNVIIRPQTSYSDAVDRSVSVETGSGK